MAEPKALAPSASKAVERVLKQQKLKHWDGDCHRFAIGYMAESFIENGVFDRAGFTSALDSEPWGFVSNFKKRLESLKLIPEGVDKTAVYE